MLLRTCSNARPAANIANELANTVLPVEAMPRPPTSYCPPRYRSQEPRRECFLKNTGFGRFRKVCVQNQQNHRFHRIPQVPFRRPRVLPFFLPLSCSFLKRSREVPFRLLPIRAYPVRTVRFSEQNRAMRRHFPYKKRPCLWWFCK